MSCSINRFKSVGGSASAKPPNSESTKEMEARMSEILAIRAAQDSGNFKVRPSWDPATPAMATPATATDQNKGTELCWNK